MRKVGHVPAGMIESLTNRFEELIEMNEGIVDEMAGFAEAGRNRCFGYEDHGCFRTGRWKPLRQLVTAHAGHFDICQEQVDPGVFLRDTLRLLAARSCSGMITEMI